MKKYLLLCSLIVVPLTCVFAQGFQRKNQSPSFFIPAGALSSSNQQEKLPPIEYMNYNARSNTNIKQRIQMQQQQLQKQTQSQNLKPVETTQQAVMPASAATKNIQKQIQKQDNSVQPENQVVSNEVQELTTDTNIQESKQHEVKKLADTIKKKVEKQTQNKADDEAEKINKSTELTYEIILEDYRNDITAISQNKPKRNQRLIEMIADYRDMPHEI